MRALDRVDRLGDAVQRGIGSDRHVGADHVVVDRPGQADKPRARWVSAWPGRGDLSSTNSSSKSDHSARNSTAPLRLPSPPMTTSASMPRSMRLRAARRRPARVLKSALRAVPSDGPSLVHDPADIGRRQRPDAVSAVDEALQPVVHPEHVEPGVERRADDGAHGGVHPSGVSSAGEDGELGRNRTLP